MHERTLIRTAESIADDLDAKLAKPTPDEWARGFRDAVIFMLAAFLIVYGIMSMGGV